MRTSPPTGENSRIPPNSCPQRSRSREAVPLLAERGSAGGRRHADESLRRRQHIRTRKKSVSVPEIGKGDFCYMDPNFVPFKTGNALAK